MYQNVSDKSRIDSTHFFAVMVQMPFRNVALQINDIELRTSCITEWCEALNHLYDLIFVSSLCYLQDTRTR